MKKKVAVVLIVLFVAAGFVFVPSLLAGNGEVSGPGAPGSFGPAPAGGGAPAAGPAPSSGSAPSSGTAANAVPAAVSTAVFSVRTEAAETRNLEAYIELNGNIVSRDQIVVMPDVGGKIASLRAGLGSSVRRGDLLAEIDPSRPGTVYSMSPVYAPVSGTVIAASGAVGSTVSPATALMTIAAGGDVEIEVMVPEREVGQLRTGLRAEVRLEAFPGETFPAAVSSVSPVMDPVSRAKKVILRFAQNDSRINAGMFAQVKLNTRTYENVTAVNSAAVTGSQGDKAVYVLNAAADAPRVSRRAVETGVTVDGLVEIKSGVSAGESVVVQGQQFLSDGAAVRIIARSESRAQNR